MTVVECWRGPETALMVSVYVASRGTVAATAPARTDGHGRVRHTRGLESPSPAKTHNSLAPAALSRSRQRTSRTSHPEPTHWLRNSHNFARSRLLSTVRPT